MTQEIKITALTNIGANIAYTTLVPVVNMGGTPETQKANLQILGNLILNGAGGSYFAQAAQATLAQTVTNAAQPNITSVGTLTSADITGNLSAGNANLGNLVVSNYYSGVLTTGSQPNITSVGNLIGLMVTANLDVGGISNLGDIANVKIFGGSAGQVLSTDGNGVLSWAADATNYGNSNVVNLLGNFGANTVITTGNVSTGNLTIYGNIIGNLLPNSNVTFDLGSANQRWKDIYLANSTIYIGESTISAGAANSIIFSGAVQADGNITANANSNVVITATDGNASYNWSFGYDGNLTLPANTFNVNYANGTQVPLGGSYSNNDVANYLPNYTGNIGGDYIDLTHDVTANVVTANFLYGDGSNISNLPVGNISSINIDGNSSNILYGNGVFAASSGLPIANGTSNINIATANGNVTITSNANNTWTFTSAGDLQLAAGNSVISSLPNNAGDGSGLSTLNLYPDNSTGDDRYLIIDPTGPAHLHLRAGGAQDASNVLLYLGGEQTYVQVDDGYHRVSINSYDAGNTTGYNWKFDFDGNLVLPGNTIAINLANNTPAFGNIASVNLDGNVSNVLTGDGTFVTLPVINANTVIWSTAPIANTSNGAAGQAAYDSGGNLYVCVATDTWAKFTGTLSW